MTNNIKHNYIKSYLVWTTGESYSKSSRYPLKPILKTPNQTQNQTQTQNNSSIQVPTRPHHDENPAVQKRDDLNFRVADREMYAQCGMNPFFSNNKNTYADQVNVQSTMLQPIDTMQTDKTH